MNQATSHFAKFTNTIDKADLYSCLALWMEECPLATTSVCDFESEEQGTCNDYITNSINKEDTCSDQQDGPLRKRKKRDNCVIGNKVKSKGSDMLVRDEISPVSNNLSNGTPNGKNTGQDRSKGHDYCDKTVNNFAKVNYVDEETKPSNRSSKRVNKIGVVMVDVSSKNIVAINCSRDNVHGVTSVLIDFSDRATNCVIYASRKPCSVCTKLMVQTGISRVCYLPLEPEYPDQDDLEKVEKLFRMSTIGQSIHVPNIQKTVLSESELKRSPYAPSKLCHNSFMLSLLSRYWSEQWKSLIAKDLKWPEYNEFKKQVDHSIEMMLEWLARITFGDLPDSVNFYQCDEINSNQDEANSESIRGNLANHKDPTILPETCNPRWQELARHMSRMANILAQRSNDPKRGVGAVILQRNQIVSACWNGYPPKAGYGDFPRASHSDGPLLAKKYAFSIHAEQAAILGRNTRDITEVSSTMFVSKTPCDECVPLILKAGIRNVVFPRDTRKRDSAFLRYSLIQRSIAHGRIRGFESRFSLETRSECESDSGAVKRTSRQSTFNGVTKSLVNDAVL